MRTKKYIGDKSFATRFYTLVERAPNKANKKFREKTPSRPERLEGSGHEKVDVEVFCCGVGKTVYSKSSSKGQVKIDFPVTAPLIFFSQIRQFLDESYHPQDKIKKSMISSIDLELKSNLGHLNKSKIKK